MLIAESKSFCVALTALPETVSFWERVLSTGGLIKAEGLMQLTVWEWTPQPVHR